MLQHQRLETPIITPTTKENDGHDRPISAAQAAQLVGGLARWQEIVEVLHALFEQGTQWARQHDLVLVDCKYELGLYQDRLMLIDELHTPDSSRYWTEASDQPRELSKEFFRQWLLQQGATGVVDIPPEVCAEISARYLELHQRLLGQPLPPQSGADPHERICKILRPIFEAGGVR
jgi:phosphoribosylaminoimidazole-succinocarboxamide synthase